MIGEANPYAGKVLAFTSIHSSSMPQEMLGVGARGYRSYGRGRVNAGEGENRRLDVGYEHRLEGIAFIMHLPQFS